MTERWFGHRRIPGTVRVAAFFVAVAISQVAHAHPLDEYVQALKVGVTPGRIDVQLVLTPGINIVSDVLCLIDLDGDDQLSVEEAESYGRRVLADLSARLDERDVILTMTRVELPMPGDLRGGNAVIRIDAVIEHRSARGEHRLAIHNAHLPSTSVYLANALLPESRDVRVVRRSRDSRQQTYELTYAIGGVIGMGWMWTVFAAAGLAVLARARLR
jgi:hypothetical protein